VTIEARGYPLLLAGNIVSTFGSSIYVVTLVLFLADATDSAVALGLVQFLAYLPAAILGPFAGALVDSWDRRRVIVWSDLVRGAIMVATAAVGLSGSMPVWLVMGATMGVSVAGVMFTPAVHAIVPELVPESALRRANGARSAGAQIANLAGSAVGGALYVALGAPLVILANGVSFLLSGVSETAIRTRPAPGGARSRTRTTRSAMEGVRYLFADRSVRSVVIVQALVNLLLPPLVVALPFVISDVWELGAEFFGYLFATVLAGGIAGCGTFSGKRARRAPDALVYRAAVGALTVAIAALSALASPALAATRVLVPLLAVTMFSAGAAIGVMHMIGVTYLQQSVAVALRGRVFAAMETLTAILLPVAYVVSGLVAQALRGSLHLVFATVAAASLGLTAYVLAQPPLGVGSTPGARTPARQSS